MVLNHPRAHRLERPVTAMVAAAPPSPTLLARMSELNFRVVHVYGLTETYGPITVCPEQEAWRDRKSTRLNSSHSQISYAVFCLKKKKYRINALPAEAYAPRSR